MSASDHAVIHRRALIHVRSAPDSDRILCEARNDAKGQSTKSLRDSPLKRAARQAR